MEKWEYKAFHVRNMNTGTDMVNALREYGEQGWELVSVNPTIDIMGFSSPQAAGLQPKRLGMPWLEPKVASRGRFCLADRE